MTAIRREILNCIDNLPDSKLEALKPILTILVNDTINIETDLTDDEKQIIAEGREEYKKGDFVDINKIIWLFQNQLLLGVYIDTAADFTSL